MKKHSRPLSSLGKNVLVLLSACALFAGLLQFASRWVYSSTRNRPFDRERLKGRLLGNRTEGAPIEEDEAALGEELGELNDAQVPDQSVILHPYFGFVANPDLRKINQYGFLGESPMTEASSDAVVIAIFGGSVADQVFYMGRNALIDRLQARGPFRNRDIRVVSTALGGYKQPQQLLVLSYFLAMGAHYDMVINLDGFNEIDGSHDNTLDGVNPFYPYRWTVHARQALDPDAAVLAGRMDIVREKRRWLRGLFGHWPLRDSAFFLTLWDALDGRERAALHLYTERLLERVSGDDLPPRVRGPATAFADDHRTLYDDTCCHVNQLGAEILATAIADAMIDRFG